VPATDDKDEHAGAGTSSSSGRNSSGNSNDSSPTTNSKDRPLQSLEGEKDRGYDGIHDVSCTDTPKASETNPDDYSCDWMHCRNACIATRYGPGGVDLGPYVNAAVTHMGGILVEDGQMLACLTGYDTNLCRSGHQPSDIPANISGIRIAMTSKYNNTSCEQACSDQRGGPTTSATEEGCGTNRPYGPFYNCNPPPPPQIQSPPPRPPYMLPGETSPRNPNLPMGPGNIVYH
jgi:hypothetical protein